jgi:hypothetical protein
MPITDASFQLRPANHAASVVPPHHASTQWVDTVTPAIRLIRVRIPLGAKKKRKQDERHSFKPKTQRFLCFLVRLSTHLRTTRAGDGQRFWGRVPGYTEIEKQRRYCSNASLHYALLTGLNLSLGRYLVESITEVRPELPDIS